jgi:preprotein translocase subunit SecE
VLLLLSPTQVALSFPKAIAASQPSPGMFSQTRSFFAEVKAELQKANWPWDPKERGMKKYRELIDSTSIVIVGLVLLSGFVSLWDLVMMNIVGAFTK